MNFLDSLRSFFKDQKKLREKNPEREVPFSLGFTYFMLIRPVLVMFSAENEFNKKLSKNILKIQLKIFYLPVILYASISTIVYLLNYEFILYVNAILFWVLTILAFLGQMVVYNHAICKARQGELWYPPTLIELIRSL